jgi:triosephosphate isomerase (TIM)
MRFPESLRRRVMAANWKMYKTPEQTVAFFERFNALLPAQPRCEIVIFPPGISIPAALQAAEGTPVEIGAQNIYWCREGAYTGEISGEMVRAAGAAWVLVGHSERRQYFRETDADVLKKTQAAIAAGLRPMVCIGERPEEHKAGRAAEILIKQFAAGIAGLTEEQFERIAIAYEPVWAIGTGQTATPEIAAYAHACIRAEVEKRFGQDAARHVRILYGGSVKPSNIEGLMREVELDGALVGGASLDAQSFIEIVKAA